MTAILMPNGKTKYFANDGTVLAGGKVYTYSAGTVIPKATFSDQAGTVPNANPVPLDIRGEALIRWDGSYKIIVKDANDVTITTVDDFTSPVTVTQQLFGGLLGASMVGFTPYSWITSTNVQAAIQKIVDKLTANTGSGLIGFIQDGVGAVARWVQDKLRESVSVEDFGLVANDPTKGVANGAAINAAVTYCSTNGYNLIIPGKLYWITPTLSRIDEAGTNLATVEMKSNLHIRAGMGATFKISDGVSSDATPTRFSMFFSNVPLSRISIIGLTIDMNGANNPISPNRGAGIYNVFTQAGLLFSGTSGGVAARGDDVHIERCRFINTAGVTCIGCMQSNSVGVTLGQRWRIINNEFSNNGLDSNDHSSLYLWSEDILCTGNTFRNPAMWDNATRTGGLVACEIHGARIRFVENNVQNYYQMCWVALNYTNTVDNVIVANNSAVVCGVCVDFDRPNANSTLIDNVEVSGNAWTLTDDPVPIALKVGVQIAAFYTVTNVRIFGNTLKKSGTSVASTFAAIGPQTIVNNTHDNIVIDGNTSRGTTFGTFVSTNATNGLGSISVTNNKWVDLTPAGAFAAPAGFEGANISAATAVKYLRIADNECIDTRNVPLCNYGVYLSGQITTLDMGWQANIGMTVLDYAEVGLTVTNRLGIYEAQQITPQWKAGGVNINLGNGSVQAEYTQHKGLVTYNARLTVGGTTSYGAGGTLSVTAPFVSRTAGIPYHGVARIFDASTGFFHMFVANMDGTSSSITLQNPGGLNATELVPVALATGDIVSVQITYNRGF